MLRVRVPPAARSGPGLRPEQAQLLSAPLDERVEAEVRLQRVEADLVAAQERSQVVPLQNVPVVAIERVTEEGRPFQLVADELRPLRRDHEEADGPVLLGDAGMPAEDRFAQHRGPFDLEEERHLAADVPDAVDFHRVLARAAEMRERNPVLALVEIVAEPMTADPAGLLAPPDPDVQADPVTAVGEEGDQLRVLMGSMEEIVAGDDSIRGARPAAVALEARPDERL